VLGFSQGIPDYSPEEEATERTIHLAPGDAAAHHCETIHRADPNRSSSRHRRAFACVFNGVSAQLDETAHAAYVARKNAQHQGLGVSED
jgi:phytanoyl-CoA hydroxylase